MGSRKKAVAIKTWNGREWEVNVRVGEKGTGRIIATAKYWDNDKAEEQAWNNLYAQLDKMGYELNT